MTSAIVKFGGVYIAPSFRFGCLRIRACCFFGSDL